MLKVLSDKPITALSRAAATFPTDYSCLFGWWAVVASDLF
jgi:hypothetical protein